MPQSPEKYLPNMYETLVSIPSKAPARAWRPMPVTLFPRRWRQEAEVQGHAWLCSKFEVQKINLEFQGSGQLGRSDASALVFPSMGFIRAPGFHSRPAKQDPGRSQDQASLDHGPEWEGLLGVTRPQAWM